MDYYSRDSNEDIQTFRKEDSKDGAGRMKGERLYQKRIITWGEFRALNGLEQAPNDETIILNERTRTDVYFKLLIIMGLFLLVWMAGTQLIHMSGLGYVPSMIVSGIVCGAGATQILVHLEDKK